MISQQNCQIRSLETVKKPANGASKSRISGRRTGWLGREDSNLEMVDWNLR